MTSLPQVREERLHLTPAAAYAAALRGEPCRVLGLGDDPATKLSARRWLGDADPVDHRLLSLCRGATVDVGCGPGRMTQALLERGHAALGIDIVAEAVHQTRARGAVALQRDVFSTLPGEGRWDTVLFADGNVGIGGNPVRLLRRAAELLASTGTVVVDLSQPGGPVQIRHIGLEVSGRRSRFFPWAIVPADQLELLAEASALQVLELIEHRGRWFAELAKANGMSGRRACEGARNEWSPSLRRRTQ